MILIISDNNDDHSEVVMKMVKKNNINVDILDLSLFPNKIGLTINYSNEFGYESSSFLNSIVKYPLSDYSTVWWRRPQAFQLHSDITNTFNANFAFSECYAAISGLWITMDSYWINNPSKDELASRKPYQLKIAHQVGLNIPKTKITSSPEEAKLFIESTSSQIIYKAFTGTMDAWRETRIVDKQDLVYLDDVRFAPVIFQEFIPLKYDLRITVIGDEIFTSVIYPNEGSFKSDYRMTLKNSNVEEFLLPDEISEKILKFMKKMDLVYGAIDFRVTPDNKYVFLEINPSGQWLFMEHRTGAPITEFFTNYLLDCDKNGGC